MSVDPKTFSKRMSKRWVSVLGNTLVDNLPKAWALMAKTFNEQIAGACTKPITILPLPTGTGKTQGLCLYCSMIKGTGVLIVTELKDEVKNIANCINEIAGKEIAIAEHGDNRNSSDRIMNAEILVITHCAYQLTMEAETSNKNYRSKWKKYSTWKNGHRKLTVVDEAINFVDSYSVTLQEIRLLSSIIPREGLGDDEQQAAQIVNTVQKLLTNLAMGKTSLDKYELITFPDLIEDCYKLKSLNKAVAQHTKTHINDSDLSKNLDVYARSLLKNLEVIASSWSIYSQDGARCRLTTARLALPLELNSVVVLDATASANPVSRVLEEHAALIDVPEIKSYRNLSIHISIGHGVSKSATSSIGVKEWGYIFDHLGSNELRESSRPLLCVHKGTEAKLGSKHLPQNWEVMHWGAINGRNDWKDCDSVVVYGLPYLPTYASAITLMAFWDWSYKLKGKVYDKDILITDNKYIEHTYLWRHIIVSLVQAINRAHCRKMTEGGNCPETNVYMFVSTEGHREILEFHLKQLMPDVVIKDWDAPKTESNSKGLNSTERKIVDALSKYVGRSFDIPVMLKEIDIVYKTFNNNYPKHLSQKQGKLHTAITAIGWEYLTAKETKERIGVYRQHFIRLDRLEVNSP